MANHVKPEELVEGQIYAFGEWLSENGVYGKYVGKPVRLIENPWKTGASLKIEALSTGEKFWPVSYRSLRHLLSSEKTSTTTKSIETEEPDIKKMTKEQLLEYTGYLLDGLQEIAEEAFDYRSDVCEDGQSIIDELIELLPKNKRPKREVEIYLYMEVGEVNDNELADQINDALVEASIGNVLNVDVQ